MSTVATRTLESSPSILALYARSAAAMLPGASLLPFVPGGGGDIPPLELVLPGVRADRDRVAAYAKVCGFSPGDCLPATYPHVLAFPLHMAAMADGSFPFGAVGLVHIENRIIQHRPIALAQEMEIRVRLSPLEPHPRGQTFALLSEVLVSGELVWEGVSRMLRRGGGGDPVSTATPRGDAHRDSEGDSAAGGPVQAVAELESGAQWSLSGDLGRRYAAVSGDRNPIHMHSLAAKPLGFPRAIAHGMWTKARCLAALEHHLPDAFSAEVRLRKPILLPARVELASATRGEEIDFAVCDSKSGAAHLEGRMRPIHDRGNPSERL